MSNDYEDKSFDEFDDTPDYIDIDGTVEALREAWKCVPHLGLSELLDSVTSVPFCTMTNAELIEQLNEFILQNQ